MLDPAFVKFQKSLEFRTRYMDIALVGDAVLSLYIRMVLYNRLRIPDVQYKSEFDGRFRANKTMQEFCSQHKLFKEAEGKKIADYFEAYLGWLYLNKKEAELQSYLNGYLKYFLKKEDNENIFLTCPLLKQLYPKLFH